MVPLYLFQEALAGDLGTGKMVTIPVTDGSRTLTCPHRLHCKLTGKIHFGIITYNCGHTNPSQGSRACFHLEQTLAHHGSGSEPVKGTDSDQIRLARALKSEMASACDGEGLFSPFLGVACGERGSWCLWQDTDTGEDNLWWEPASGVST